MNRWTKRFAAVVAPAVLVGVMSVATPATAAVSTDGCSVTNSAPHKSGNTVTDSLVLTCTKSKNDGDFAYLKLWRNNGDGTYDSWATEHDESSAFSTQTIAATHTCTSTKSYVWHAEFYGSLIGPSGANETEFSPVNSADVTLACA
jgi:hypothetical protein